MATVRLTAEDRAGWRERWEPLARRVASSHFRRFPRTDTPYQAMLDACLVAAWLHDEEGLNESFMAQRMRWAVVDEMRRNSWGVRRGREGFRTHKRAPLIEDALRFAHVDSDPTLRMDIERALKRLPKREREIIRHRDLQGHDQNTIAGRLGVSPERVSQLRTRGLALLRAIMAEDAPVRRKRKR